MRTLRYVALLSVLMLPAAFAQAQFAVGVRVGPGFGYVAGPPVCAYGYYNYAPYACAPYGYYGPRWFTGGVFIGAGPWYHGGYWGRGPGWGYGRGYYGRDRFEDRGFDRARWNRGREGEGFRGGNGWGHVGGGFHGGGGFRGSFHGGGRR